MHIVCIYIHLHYVPEYLMWLFFVARAHAHEDVKKKGWVLVFVLLWIWEWGKQQGRGIVKAEYTKERRTEKHLNVVQEIEKQGVMEVQVPVERQAIRLNCNYSTGLETWSCRGPRDTASLKRGHSDTYTC